MVRLRAMAAPTEAAPKRLWPQPWPWGFPSARASLYGTAAFPMPGRASYSARIPMTGRPLPKDATKAVGMSATPRSTRKPSASRTSASSRADRSSRRASSEYSQSRMDMSRMGPCRASTDCRAVAFSEGRVWALALLPAAPSVARPRRAREKLWKEGLPCRSIRSRRELMGRHSWKGNRSSSMPQPAPRPPGPSTPGGTRDCSAAWLSCYSIAGSLARASFTISSGYS